MRVLVLSAHGDDETLGCGGALLHHAAAGHEVSWGIATLPRGVDGEVRRAEIDSVARSAGIAHHEIWHHVDGGLDSTPSTELIGQIRELASKGRPNRVYVVHAGDVHSDHRTLAMATAAALKPFRRSIHGVRQLLEYETVSSTEQAPNGGFDANFFLDISDYFDAKLDLLTLYASQVEPPPSPRSHSVVQALARLRGATIGSHFAEAFHVNYWID